MSQRPTVVLIHGLFGSRKLLWFDYFRNVRQLYGSMGLRVIVPGLPWAGSLEQRANALARQLENESGPLHLLGHSMGGLDARYWINHLGGTEKVASLTTLATPHHGSPAADLVCNSISPFRLFAGVHSLTTNNISRFNARTPDLPHIIYRSYSAARPLHELPWIVRHYGRYIQKFEDNNDAQVSVKSAAWGDHIATLPCDHYEMIFLNFWFNPFKARKTFDPMPVYRQTAEWILTEAKKQ